MVTYILEIRSTVYTPARIILHVFILQEQLYKNSEAQICPKIKNKLRTTEARLQIQIGT